MYRVLLVDDERIILDGLTRAVPWQDMGCDVVSTAGDGREGLRLVRQLKPVILFTDIRMPGEASRSRNGRSGSAEIVLKFPLAN